MRIQLMLPPVPGFFIRNVVLAAYSCCSHPGNVFTDFILRHVFYKETPLFIKAGSIFSFFSSWQYRSQRVAHAVIISVSVVKLNVYI
jgi:hypothetical protein